MKTHLLFFVSAFTLGCVAALAARTAWSKPPAGAAEPSVAAAYSQRVAHAASPTSDSSAEPEGRASASAPSSSTKGTSGPADPHAGHAAAKPGATVNTICAICGMDVDPSIKPATYRGQLVGFGCRMCPPKFARDPDRYGPAALENKVVND
jgi:hypothetical protein